MPTAAEIRKPHEASERHETFDIHRRCAGCGDTAGGGTESGGGGITWQLTGGTVDGAARSPWIYQ